MEYSNKMINGCGYFSYEISGYFSGPSDHDHQGIQLRLICGVLICGVLHPILEAKHFAFGLQPLTRPNASAIADGVANGSPWQVPKGGQSKSGWFLGRSAGKSHNSFGRWSWEWFVAFQPYSQHLSTQRFNWAPCAAMVLKFKATSNARIPMDSQEKWVMLIDKPSRKMGMWWDMHRAIPQDGNTAAKLHIKCCQSDHQKRSSGSCQESQIWHRCACTVSFFSSLFKSFQVFSSRFRFVQWRLNLS